MPGHKGKNFLGFEGFDITEIPGADSLYEASGIIAESEAETAEYFGKKTLFSTEGSSHCIRAMLYLFKLWAGNDGVLIAGRNAHKAFLSAAALLDINVEWMFPKDDTSYLSCEFDIADFKSKCESLKSKGIKIGVYITRPDYLGNLCDITEISEICNKNGFMLIVDNAHGAYLNFLEKNEHPMSFGATICCDSAHKTFPVLTGGAYLHYDNEGPFGAFIESNAKAALSLFGSTSPSYLILQSLDNANRYIADNYKKRLSECIANIDSTKEDIKKIGFRVLDGEPLKITLMPKIFGYCGNEIADILEKQNIYCEFADSDFIVFMITPENTKDELSSLVNALSAIPPKTKIESNPPSLKTPKKVLNPKEAIFSESEIVDIGNAKGRILAEFNIACPPAVPILVCGEKIDDSAIECFEYYGIDRVRVIK